MQRRSRSPRLWIRGGLGVGDRGVRVDVGGAAHALPVGDRAAARAVGLDTGRSAPPVPPLPWSSPVITTAAFSSRGRNQNRGSGFRSGFICPIRLASRRCCSSACGIATLSRSTQSGWTSPGLAPKKRSSERIGWSAVPSRSSPGPGRVALARLDDRAGEVVGERGGLAAVGADAAQRHRRVGGGRGRVRVERGDRLVPPLAV